MALTINNFIGFETGGEEELLSTTGSVGTTGARSGTYALTLGPTSIAEVKSFPAVASAGNSHITGFAIKCSNWKSGGGFLINFKEGIGVLGHQCLEVGINTSGDTLYLENSFGTKIATGTTAVSTTEYNFIEVYWDYSNSGAAEVWLNGTQEISVTGQDFLNGGGTYDGFELRAASETGVDAYIDDIYVMSGAASASDMLGDAEVFGYSHSVTGVTPSAGGNATAGADLDAGNWQSTVDGNLGTDGEYTASPAYGSVDMDGPNGDGNVDGDSNIKAVKALMHMDRDGGGGSTHYIFLGDSGDGDSPAAYADGVDWPEITTTPTWYTIVKDSDLPTSSQDLRVGFGTGGAQDVHLYEMWSFLLHVPATGPTAITGTIDQTLPSLTQSATASSIGGAITQTLPSLTQSATAVEIYTGTIAQSLPALTQSATASIAVDVTATIEQTLPALAQSATAALEYKANAAQTLPSLSQSATAVEVYTSTIGQTLPAVNQSATASEIYVLTGAQTLPSLAQSAAASSIGGAISQTLPSLTQSATAVEVFKGPIVQTLPALTQAATASTGTAISGNIAQTLPSLTQSATAVAEIGAIMNQIQGSNMGADLYNGTII